MYATIIIIIIIIIITLYIMYGYITVIIITLIIITCTTIIIIIIIIIVITIDIIRGLLGGSAHVPQPEDEGLPDQTIQTHTTQITDNFQNNTTT